MNRPKAILRLGQESHSLFQVERKEGKTARVKDIKEKAEKFIHIVDELRKKCPWDKKQTHASIARYLQEEAMEVIEAIHSGESERLKEELGDLLFQILFHARIAEEKGHFNISGIIDAISGKMVSRHPHVFREGEVPGDDEETLRAFWDSIKAREKKGKKEISAEKIAKLKGPSLFQKALFIGNQASRKGFDWRSAEEIVEKLEEEVLELKESLKKRNRRETLEETGDILLVITNLCRFLQMDFEKALERSLVKFAKRFDRLCREVKRRGLKMEECSLDELEGLWQKIKRQD